MKLNRREFSGVTAGLAMSTSKREKNSDIRTRYPGSITDIEGLKVGHFTHPEKTTGCTVLLCDEAATAAVDVRGSAPGTRETDLLRPTNMVEKINAILLSGGSAFGLDAASGVVQFLEEQGKGFNVGVARIPIVPAAILFDLSVGNPKIRPDLQAGYSACQNASSELVPEGSVGAGSGATVGKFAGLQRAMKGGIGTSSIRVDDLIVAGLVAVNSIGDVIDPYTGQIVAGMRSKDGTCFEDSLGEMKKQLIGMKVRAGENTTIGIVATNASFSKTQLTKVAEMSHDGLARAIRPSHLPFDGDTIFALATGTYSKADLGQVGALAAEALSMAIINAVISATSVEGILSYQNLPKA